MASITGVSGLIHSHTISASYEEMKLLRDAFRASLTEIGISREDIHNWMVVFSEAVTNGIEHGARGDPRQTVTVRWGRLGDVMELLVIDPGLGFYATDSGSLLRSRGYGLKLLQHFCDSVEHLLNPSGGHTLRLARKVGAFAPSEGTSGASENSPFLQLLANFYGNLGYPVSASALLQPIVDYVTERFENKLSLELRVADTYATVGATLPYYRGAPPCQRCNDCKPFQKMAIHSLEDGRVQCFPLRLGRRSLGSLAVSGLPGGGAAAELMENVATCIALAVENEYQQRIQKVTQEALLALKVASNMQSRQRKIKETARSLVGRIHTFEERAQMVAGDILECAVMPDGSYCMLIADVMGKGVAAAFLGGIFRGGWHLLSKTQTHPLLLIKELNRFLYDELNGQSMFVTTGLAHLSADGKTMSFINAGHTSLYLQDRRGELRAINSSGPPLGLFSDPYYELLTVPVADLARLYMPTDGLYSFGADPSHFDPKQLENLLRENSGKTVQEVWEAVQLSHRNALESQPDDQALLVWERK